MRGRALDTDTLLLTLTDQQEKFLDWLTGNRPEGQSQAAFARDLGVTPAALTSWKKDPSFRSRWEMRLRETHAHPDIINGHLRALNEKALKGDTAAIKLYHEIVQRMWPDDVEDEILNLTDAQLRDLAENLDLLGASDGDQ